MDWKLYLIQGIEGLFLGLGSYFDLKDRRIPEELFLIFGGLGLLCHFLGNDRSICSVLIGVLPGLLCLLVGRLTNEAIGYGDGIGFCILGLFREFFRLLPLAFCAFCLCAVFGMWKMLVKKRGSTETMPFYPFLFLAWIGVSVL